MAQSIVNSTRFDAYKNFKFRVRWDGRYVAGISKVSGLKRTTEVVLACAVLGAFGGKVCAGRSSGDARFRRRG